MFDLDEAMAAVVGKASEPALAAIKLAWWRERLEELDEGKVPAEPRLAAAAEALLPRGLDGKALSAMEEGWALLLDPDDNDRFMQGVASRGPALFQLAARLLGVGWSEQLDNAAQSFAASDLARRGLFTLGAQQLTRSASVAPRAARPLTAFAALAYRDMRSGGPPFEPEATPARAWALLRHRMTGRLG